MCIRNLVCSFALFLLVCSLSLADKPLPAPPGYCWEYNPTYCYLAVHDCEELAGIPPISELPVATPCGTEHILDDNTYPELLAGYRSTTSPGYQNRNWTILSRICGSYYTCVVVQDGVDVNGLPNMACKRGTNRGDWWMPEVELTGYCSGGLNP